MLKHGGNRREASRRYNIPVDAWLDLSTGINPVGWPVTDLDAESWQRLPEADDGLEAAACNYYETEHVLPVAGSQAAIQLLPQLRPESVVAVVEPAYAEHAHAWQRQGHQISGIPEHQIETVLSQLDVLVVVNPNNPTGQLYDQETLLDWHRQLSQKGGWLIVDEAFMDSTPEYSLAAYSDRPGLIVLRSLGKFFGLAGARCGFVLSEAELLTRLQEQLGPWSISGPSRDVAKPALLDKDWQIATRHQLHERGMRLQTLLSRFDLTPHGGTPLFQWLIHNAAWQIHDALARQGILTRFFADPCSLRFGLPGDENEWQRLTSALDLVMRSNLNESLDEQP